MLFVFARPQSLMLQGSVLTGLSLHHVGPEGQTQGLPALTASAFTC